MKITKLELFAFCLALFFSSCGTDYRTGLPGNDGKPGEQGNPGQNGNDGPIGQPGTSCTVLKNGKKCYLKCPDGTWAYVGKECG